MIARYSLQDELNTFDYYGWQAQVAAMGATEIVFDTSAFSPSIWSPEAARRRFETIIQPGPAFLGLPSREGTDGEPMASSRFRYFVGFANERSFPRLQTVAPARSVEYTVTMRTQMRKSSWRNSNDAAWRIFAEDIGATVIEDYDIVPMPLVERMALYAGAKMNLGVTCGPLFMCSLSTYPCAIFAWQRQWGTGFFEKTGLLRGAQMPWMGPEQFAVWEDDNLDVLRRWFDRWYRDKPKRG